MAVQDTLFEYPADFWTSKLFAEAERKLREDLLSERSQAHRPTITSRAFERRSDLKSASVVISLPPVVSASGQAIVASWFGFVKVNPTDCQMHTNITIKWELSC